MISKCLIFFGIVIFSSPFIRATPNLPGLDQLKSGFDAAAMLSSLDLDVQVGDKSRYAIFDLSESGPTFTLNVNGHSQVFETAALTQVTDLSIRKENFCEVITSSFDEFYRYFFQSTSFGVSLGIKDFSLSLNYHKLLEKVYNETTKNNSAVGISSTWWGLYSIQLPPPFLIPLDKQFNRSLSILNAIGTPTTDVHQQFYKQVVQAFGTHYVSSVVVGGTASMYTFLANEYHLVNSYKKQEEQISFQFEFMKLKLSGNSNSSSVEQKISADFKQNSQAVTIFHPTVADGEGDLKWNIWLEKAGSQPVVVNRTVEVIYDLVYDYPIVQTHLKKTIDFYIKNGRQAETIAEVNA